MKYNIQENTLYIFTDGASRPVFNDKLKRKTGRHGGMGIWFVYYDSNFKLIKDDKSDYISYTQATNQDMELCASVGALKYLTENDDLSHFKKIVIVSDSMFLCDNWQCAVYGHRMKVGWKTINGDPVTHKTDRKKLAKYRYEVNRLHRKKVEFERVKGHQKNDADDERIEFNNTADISAVKGAQSKNRILKNNSGVRKRFFNTQNKCKGFLDIQGQEILIHMYTYRHLRKGYFKYDCEVVSWDSEFYTKTGWIYYDKKTLSAEYIYFVRMKNNGSNQIEEIISEHTKKEIKEKMIADGIDTSILYGKLGKN